MMRTVSVWRKMYPQAEDSGGTSANPETKDGPSSHSYSLPGFVLCTPFLRRLLVPMLALSLMGLGLLGLASSASAQQIPPPSAPAIQSVTPGNAQITVRWTCSLRVVGGPPGTVINNSYSIFYIVNGRQYRVNVGISINRNETTYIDTCTATITGVPSGNATVPLVNGQLYQFAVYATNGGGTSPGSEFSATPG